MTRATALLLVFAAAVLIVGCGQKRDLVLPDAPPAPEAPQSPDSEDSTSPAQG